ncbi:MAG: triose-phosphate isomerase [Bdellovibrionaceae bacterium]|nr:triose-phosphate isomerase [Pseudobdellovibrionaceae bacterium]
MKKLFAANWKLHKTPAETRAFFKAWKDKAGSLSADRAQVVFFPTAICLEAASQELADAGFEWGAQNCYFEDKGAFTGETSAQAVQSLGGRWILIGHSERRSIFGETDELCAKKIKKVQDLGLTPMFCIGETLQERESGKTFDVLKDQLIKGLAHADKTKPLAIAYEPVWAIGTGKVAGPEQVQEAHQFLFEQIKSMGLSTATPLLYGGSVKADNAGALGKIPHVDGFLVGGASLEVDSFLAIAKAAQ